MLPSSRITTTNNPPICLNARSPTADHSLTLSLWFPPEPLSAPLRDRQVGPGHRAGGLSAARRPGWRRRSPPSVCRGHDRGRGGWPGRAAPPCGRASCFGRSRGGGNWEGGRDVVGGFMPSASEIHKMHPPPHGRRRRRQSATRQAHPQFSWDF